MKIRLFIALSALIVLFIAYGCSGMRGLIIVSDGEIVHADIVETYGQLGPVTPVNYDVPKKVVNNRGETIGEEVVFEHPHFVDESNRYTTTLKVPKHYKNYRITTYKRCPKSERVLY